MSKLKTKWAIRTTDEQLKAYILTLEALGYPIFSETKGSINNSGAMVNCEHIGIYGCPLGGVSHPTNP